MDLRLAEQLVNRPPRETAGARSASRFDFQKDWVICLLLDLHRNETDYLLICDYHEDVIVLDSEHDPSVAAFYQVKTQTGRNWTVRALVARPKGKDGKLLPSILGKLYSNYVLFEDNTKSLHFISNSPFKMALSSKAPSLPLRVIKCAELDQKEIDQIKNNLTKECRVYCSIPLHPLVFFEVTPLSLQDHETHAKGKVAEFLEAMLPGRKHAVSAVYRVIFDGVRQRTGYEGPIKTFGELQSLKGIARSTLDALLEEIGGKVDPEELWEEIRERLVAEGVPALEVHRIGIAWHRYEIDRMDDTKESLQRLRMEVASWCAEICGADPSIALKELGRQICSRARLLRIAGAYSSEFFHAVALMETYEIESLPETDTKSEEKTE
ncbi:MAG: DUF4297 domain-containing protein [Thermodesulfobacteriota bacterium]|jgi:hypothetical protein